MNIIELSKIMASCQKHSRWKCLCVSRRKQNGGGGGLLRYSMVQQISLALNNWFIPWCGPILVRNHGT